MVGTRKCHYIGHFLSPCASPEFRTLRLGVTAVSSPFRLPNPKEPLGCRAVLELCPVAEPTSKYNPSGRQMGLVSRQSSAHLSLLFTLLDSWCRELMWASELSLVRLPSCERLLGNPLCSQGQIVPLKDDSHGYSYLLGKHRFRVLFLTVLATLVVLHTYFTNG